MQENEYIDLLNVGELITAKHLKNKENRTLIYGLDADNRIFHVYLKDEQIYIVTYNYMEGLLEFKAISNNGYIPNKTVFAQYSDYEFCKLLQKQCIHIPFSLYAEPEKEPTPYFGSIL